MVGICMHTDREEKELACCVRGYHVYKAIWAAAVGEDTGMQEGANQQC